MRRDAEDENAEGEVVCWLGVFPHVWECQSTLEKARKKMKLTFHGSFDLFHSLQDLPEALVDVGSATTSRKIIDDLDCSIDQRRCLLNHVDMRQNEACLRALGVEATLERANQTQVVVRVTLRGVGQGKVEEGIGGCIGKKRLEVQSIQLQSCELFYPSIRALLA